MNRIFLLLAFSFLVLFNCKEEDPPQPISIVGVWKPLKMVKTTVVNYGQPSSATYIYEDCEQKSRFVFNEDVSGKVSIQGFLNSQCLLLSDQTMNYEYNSKTGEILIKYVTFKDEGLVTDLTDKTMNLKIEKIEANVYESKTYSLVKVN